MNIPDKIKGIKILQEDGTYTNEIPLEVEIENVIYDTNNNAKQVIDNLQQQVAQNISTIEIGEVTTLEPGEKPTISVENNSGKAIFNFGIPQGSSGLGLPIPTIDNIGQVPIVDSTGTNYELTSINLNKNEYVIGNGLILDPESNTLSVNTSNIVEEDNTLPITSAAVYTSIGNIEKLLETI